MRRITALIAGIVVSNLSAADPLDTWHQRNPIPTASRLISVAYGNGQWIAIGLGSTLVASSDGINWNKRHPLENHDAY